MRTDEGPGLLNSGTECPVEEAAVLRALCYLGRDQSVQARVLDLLRRLQADAQDSSEFKDQVRWPLTVALLEEGPGHIVELSDGTLFEIGADSRIERAVLLSDEEHPDHLWEPQTTKLLKALARAGGDVLIGGAYIGDQALPVARSIPVHRRVHAFEPMEGPYRRLLRNVELNGQTNVVAIQSGLWRSSGVHLRMTGHEGIASSEEASPDEEAAIPSVSIDDYVERAGISSLSLIVLDIEGGEGDALQGAIGQLSKRTSAPAAVVYEVHSSYVDWSSGLAAVPVVEYLASLGYVSFALRDFHSNVNTQGLPIEVVPLESVYLEGPPHGFNMVAVRDEEQLRTLGVKWVPGVSPKLLIGRDPRLHLPTDWRPY